MPYSLTKCPYRNLIYVNVTLYYSLITIIRKIRPNEGGVRG